MLEQTLAAHEFNIERAALAITATLESPSPSPDLEPPEVRTPWDSEYTYVTGGANTSVPTTEQHPANWLNFFAWGGDQLHDPQSRNHEATATGVSAQNHTAVSDVDKASEGRATQVSGRETPSDGGGDAQKPPPATVPAPNTLSFAAWLSGKPAVPDAPTHLVTAWAPCDECVLSQRTIASAGPAALEHGRARIAATRAAARANLHLPPNAMHLRACMHAFSRGACISSLSLSLTLSLSRSLSLTHSHTLSLSLPLSLALSLIPSARVR